MTAERGAPAGLLAVQVHVETSIPDDVAGRIKRTLAVVLQAEGVSHADIAVVITGHQAVRDLNRRFLDHDFDTDVLAFPLGEADEASVEGEIYVDAETARERHVEFDASFADELVRYAIHGLLHLLGYSDKTEADGRHMRSLEDRYLKGE